MTYGEMGSRSGPLPDNVSDGICQAEQELGLLAQSIDAPCLAELLDNQKDAKRPNGWQILRGTVDTGEPLTTIPEIGANTVRQCGRQACQAQCQITVGSYCNLTKVVLNEVTEPAINCKERPVRRLMWHGLRVLGI